MARLPRHILFDWNGTLQDDVLAAVAGTNALLLDQGSAPIGVERYREVFSFPARSSYAALGIDLEHHDWDALCDRFFSVFTSHPVELFPGARESLRALRAAGASLSIVTTSEQRAVERALDRYGIRDAFDAVSGQSDASAGSKVGQALALFRGLGIGPEEACMVGDTGHDKEVADEIGCACVLLASGYESRPRLAARGVPVLDGIADLPAHFGLAPVASPPPLR
jgi:phosphoglycolate phosphatase